MAPPPPPPAASVAVAPVVAPPPPPPAPVVAPPHRLTTAARTRSIVPPPTPPAAGILAGTTVCATGLPIVTKGRVKAAIRSAGGTYSSALSPAVTVLVACAVHSDVESVKYKAARHRGLQIVTPEWLFASIEAGRLLYCWSTASTTTPATRGLARRDASSPPLLGAHAARVRPKTTQTGWVNGGKVDVCVKGARNVKITQGESIVVSVFQRRAHDAAWALSTETAAATNDDGRDYFDWHGAFLVAKIPPGDAPSVRLVVNLRQVRLRHPFLFFSRA